MMDSVYSINLFYLINESVVLFNKIDNISGADMKSLFSSELYCFIFILISFFSCEKKTASPVIARVGKATLTVDDLVKSIPQEYRSQITPEQNINYVKQWINTELLFQEALRRKIDREPVIRDRLKKMKKDLLSAELINRSYSKENISSIDETTIKNYYETNKEKFIREKNVAKYLEVVVNDLKTAWYISRNANAENFLTLAAEYSQQPYPENRNVPYTALDEIHPEIRDAIISTNINSTSSPVKSDIGYHVIFVIDKLEKGGICKEEEIREELITQITVKNQKENLEKLLAELRLKTIVEFNPDLIKQLKQSS